MHCTIADEPKVGIQLLLISYLFPVPGSYSLFPYILLLNSESLRSLLPFKFLIVYHSHKIALYHFYKTLSFKVDPSSKITCIAVFFVAESFIHMIS